MCSEALQLLFLAVCEERPCIVQCLISSLLLVCSPAAPSTTSRSWRHSDQDLSEAISSILIWSNWDLHQVQPLEEISQRIDHMGTSHSCSMMTMSILINVPASNNYHLAQNLSNLAQQAKNRWTEGDNPEQEKYMVHLWQRLSSICWLVYQSNNSAQVLIGKTITILAARKLSVLQFVFKKQLIKRCAI